MTYVGVDWSDSFHWVYITDDTGDRLAAFSIEYTPEGIESLFSKVKEHARNQAEILFALETPKGLLSSAILEAGFTLYPVLTPRRLTVIGTGTRCPGKRTTTLTRWSWPISCAPTGKTTGLLSRIPC